MRGEATSIDYSNNHSFPNLLSPYASPFVPDPRLDNSGRLQNLIVDGKLMLRLDDAIALALENNLDVEVARYNLPIAQTDYLRAKGGGAVRGVAGSFQSTTAFSGALGGGLNNGGGGVSARCGFWQGFYPAWARAWIWSWAMLCIVVGPFSKPSAERDWRAWRSAPRGPRWMRRSIY
jgi:hypothetical protein